MRKKSVSAVCVIIMGLFLYSCSDPVMPKQVKIKGTVRLPVRVATANFGGIFTDSIKDAFTSQTGEDETLNIEVFDVQHDGLEVQTFCIHLPIPMTEDLNPNHFLQTVNRQLNDGMSTDASRIEIQIPLDTSTLPPGDYEIPIDLSSIKLPDIPPVYLDDIARYVKDIDFDKCDGTVVSGIGINFFLTTEPIPGLAMIVTCDNLNFSGEPQPLKQWDNIFGNSEELILELADYSDRNTGKKLEFKMELLSTNPSNPKTLLLNTANLTPGVPLKMTGEVHFFQNWTHTEIYSDAAMKSSSEAERFTGSFPSEDGYFDLSALKKYLGGGFSFNGLRVQMYMSNLIDIDLHLKLDPQYSGKESEDSLFDDHFTIFDEPLILDSSYLNDGIYIKESLPHTDKDTFDDDNMNKAAIVSIFDVMPADLKFTYNIELPDILKLTPETFAQAIKEDDSKLATAMMIWLPLSLVAQDGSAIMIPGMFDDVDDLLGRDEPDDLPVKIQNIRMTIDLLNPIFSGGNLFIDGEHGVNDPKLFFPDGITLGGKKKKKAPERIVMNFTQNDLKIIQQNLIKPNVWIKFKEGDIIQIPKNLGVLGLKFEMGGIQIGEEFFK